MSGRLLGVLEVALPAAVAALLLSLLGGVWAARLTYPFDLEWMEGGMLAHAWRLDRGLPLYVAPNPDFVPYVYPPGYPALLAALGKVFGLSPALGRAVSILGILGAAAGVAHAARRQGAPLWLAGAGGVVLLGAWPHTGAFYDLVRPDSLALGLLAWSIALVIDGRRGTPVAAGLLLAASFLCKHNMAAFGPALLLAVAWRDGWRPALAFAAASAGPALAAVGWLQWASDGHFLTYLLEVPTSHPSSWDRVWPGTLRELGTPLPLATAVPALWLVALGLQRQRTWPMGLAAFLPVGAGMVAGWWGTYVPPPKESGMFNFPSSFAFWAVGAAPVAVALTLGGQAVDRLAGRGGGPGWRYAAGVAVGGTGLAIASAMRAHNGGFLNVHMPLFLVVALAFAVTLARWRADHGGPVVRVAAVALICAQLGWSIGLLDRDRFVPTPADEALGWRFVEAARAAEGPVLSPCAAWIPVLAGKEPSLHYMGLWDLEYPGGPYHDRRGSIARAVEERRWGAVLACGQKFPYRVEEHYEGGPPWVEQRDRALMPKTGWRARPVRVLTPR